MAKVKIIYGAPASGKSTYAKQHMSNNDLLFDFDDIMQNISGLPYQTSNDNLIDYVMSFRDVIIDKARRDFNIDTIYIITVFISKDLQSKLDGLDVEFIKMSTSIDKCKKRLAKSNRTDKDEIEQVIEDWFAQYDLDYQQSKTEYVTKEQKMKFYKSKAWRDLRQQVLKRDNHECQECKRLGYVTVNDPTKHKTLDIDHVRDIYHHPELALEISNCRTLCVPHHNKKHGRVFKRKKKIEWEDERW